MDPKPQNEAGPGPERSANPPKARRGKTKMGIGEGGSHAKRFISVLIAVVIALVLSPLIFQAIKSANSSGNITGTLATIVNLIPLFYYLSAALIIIADVYTFLKVFKMPVTLPSGRKI